MVSAHFVSYRTAINQFIYQNVPCLSISLFLTVHLRTLHLQCLRSAARSLGHDAVAHLLDGDAPRRLLLLPPPLLRVLVFRSDVVRRFRDGGGPRGGGLGLLSLAKLVLGHGLWLAVVLRSDDS